MEISGTRQGNTYNDDLINRTKEEPLMSFPSGARRSETTGKGSYHCISPIGLRRLALRYQEGAASKGERNWEKGFPLSRCVDSAMRHLAQIMEGDRTEDHWAAIAWQAFTAMHFEEMISRDVLPDSLDDLPKYMAGPHAVTSACLTVEQAKQLRSILYDLH